LFTVDTLLIKCLYVLFFIDRRGVLTECVV